jgi:hypothetical protein
MFHEQRRRWGETAVARQGEWGEWATMAASGAVDGGTKNSPHRVLRPTGFFALPGSSPYQIIPFRFVSVFGDRRKPLGIRGRRR